MKKTYTLVYCLILFSGIYGQNISGRVTSSIYTFERFDTVDVSNTHIRAYQNLYLNINKNKFALRTSLNLENDFSTKLQDDPRFRVYNLYLEARDLADLFTIKLGRQPLFNTVGGGLFDGANLIVKKDNYKFSAYYGGNVPAYQKLEFTGDLKNDYIYGGRFTASSLYDFRVSLSYVKKNFKSHEYWASRLDEELNPITVLIRSYSNEYEFASAELGYEMENLFSIDTRYDYDITLEKSSKFEVFGEYKQFSDFRINMYYNYREPRVKYNSIFSVFDYGNTEEFEIGTDYILNKEITFIGKFGQVNYKDEESQRLTLGANLNIGSITYRKNFGYAGELDAISLYSAHSFLEGLMTPSIGISISKYKLSKDSEENDLTTILAGLNVRPWRALSFDIQGQYLNNKIYQNDYRLFFKINYWFNNNLNLF